jgi:hypothetical protein
MVDVVNEKNFNCISEDTDTESVYSDVSIFDEPKNSKLRLFNAIPNDSGRISIIRQVMHSKVALNGDKSDDKIFYKKKTVISFYTTSLKPGMKIRNAVSGSFEPFFVGTKHEDLFFKVSLNTGELGQAPYSNHLYFNSPEEYETLFYTKLSDDIKHKWKATYSVALDNLRNKKIKDLKFIQVR